MPTILPRGQPGGGIGNRTRPTRVALEKSNSLLYDELDTANTSVITLDLESYDWVAARPNAKEQLNGCSFDMWVYFSRIGAINLKRLDVFLLLPVYEL